MPLKRKRRDWTSSDDESDSLNLSFFRAPAPATEPETIPGINRLTTWKIKQLLVQSAGLHSDVRKLVTNAIEAEKTAEENKVISFYCESSDVWRKINTQYKKKKGSQQYDISLEVVDYVTSTIKDIAAACRQHPNPATRFNGLTVLRKIGKTICLSEGNVMAHEVRKHFQGNTSLVDAMFEIVEKMSVEEKKNVQLDGKPEGLFLKLAELAHLAEDYCVFVGLVDVLGLIAETDEDEGDGEDGEDEDDEDEGDGEDVEEDEHDGDYYDEEDEDDGEDDTPLA